MSQRLWMLAGLCVVIALGVSVYRKPGAVGASTGRALAAPSTALPTVQTRATGHSTLPQAIERTPVERASRDPFAATPAAPPPLPVAPPVAPVVPAPPPPAAPPLNLRYAGRMTGPDGAAQVFVLFGETSLTASIGQTLPNGYRVEAITARAIELSHPNLNSTARLDLPEPPQHEIR